MTSFRLIFKLGGPDHPHGRLAFHRSAVPGSDGKMGGATARQKSKSSVVKSSLMAELFSERSSMFDSFSYLLGPLYLPLLFRASHFFSPSAGLEQLPDIIVNYRTLTFKLSGM